MIKWIAMYRSASAQTKFFIWNWVIYLIALIVTSAYVYGRMDYVRSYKMPTPRSEFQAK